MKAIIAPGVTDLNKGDQALVWESVRLVQDTGLFNTTYIITSGSTLQEEEDLCGQSREKGYQFVNNIIPHPRRGRHEKNVIDSYTTLIRMISLAAFDYLSRNLLLYCCKNNRLVRIFFGDKIFKSIQIMKSCDAFFIKGGGFIHSYGEKSAPYVIWYSLFYLKLAKKLGKKLIILPNSFGPFEGLGVKKQVRKILKKADLVYAREAISAAALGRLLGKKIKIADDLGFYLKSAVDAQIDKYFEKYNISDKQKLIGLTIRPWRFPGMESPDKLYEKYLSALREFIRYCNQLGYKVLICNQSLGPNSHEDDRNAISSLISGLENTEYIWFNENLPCNLLKLVYARCKLVLGTRFHSVIFSLTSHVPCIAISYGGNKGDGIMKDLALSRFTIPINDINPDSLIQKFKDLENNYSCIRELIEEKTTGILKNRHRIISDICKIFNSYESTT